MWIIVKRSRYVEPYAGPACEAAGVPRGRRYILKENAEADAARLSEVNPVGFDVEEVSAPVEHLCRTGIATDRRPGQCVICGRDLE